VATGWLVLKNDIIALDLPLKYYIAQCIQQGYVPWWINTWEMGFPLHSPLCWSIFNPITLLFSLASPYHIYQLHTEWLLYVWAAGVGMYRLGRFALHWDTNAALYAGVVYMLSGFVLANAQFLGFIAAVAYTPFVLANYLQLLQKPNATRAISLVFWGYCMLTGSYPAFMLVGCYVLLGALLHHLYQQYRRLSLPLFAQQIKVIAWWHGISLALFVLVSLPLLYGLYDILPHLNHPAALDVSAVSSNYLHPMSLLGWLLPAFSVSEKVLGVTTLMQGVYMGLPTLVLCIAVVKRPKLFDTQTLGLLLVAAFFVGAALAHHLPIRAFMFWYVPLMQYFRHAGLLRYFGLLFFLLAMGRYYTLLLQAPNNSLISKNLTKAWQTTLGLLALIGVLIVAHIYQNQLNPSYQISLLSRFLPHADIRYFWLMQVFGQFILLGTMYKYYTNHQTKLFKTLLCLDLVMAAWLNLPFTVISQYSATDIMQKMPSVQGFPIQNAYVNAVKSTLTDNRGNKWYNINVFTKQVSTQTTYTGSLTLQNANKWYASKLYPTTANNPIVYLSHDYRPLSTLNQTDSCNIYAQTVFLPDSAYKNLPKPIAKLFANDTLSLLSIKPNQITVQVSSNAPQMLCLIQNYYPHWKAYYNHKPLVIMPINHIFMGVSIPAGKGTVTWLYQPTTIIWLSYLSLVIWAMMIATLLIKTRFCIL
jgi:hypothetical protein